MTQRLRQLSVILRIESETHRLEVLRDVLSISLACDSVPRYVHRHRQDHDDDDDDDNDDDDDDDDDDVCCCSIVILFIIVDFRVRPNNPVV